MDIKLEKKAWYIRYRYYLAGGGLDSSRSGVCHCAGALSAPAAD